MNYLYDPTNLTTEHELCCVVLQHTPSDLTRKSLEIVAGTEQHNIVVFPLEPVVQAQRQRRQEQERQPWRGRHE